MATTVLSGTSGALYYKPAGTRGTFAPADVSTANDTVTVETFLNFKVGDPVKFSVVNQQGGTPSGTLPTGITAGTTYFVIAYTACTGVLQVSATLGALRSASRLPVRPPAPTSFRLLTAITL